MEERFSVSGNGWVGDNVSRTQWKKCVSLILEKGGFRLHKEGGRIGSMTHASVTIQITPDSKPSMPSWMGEVATFAQILAQTGILQAIQDRVRFARARFGQYDLIDFAIVLIGYGVSAGG